MSTVLRNSSIGIKTQPSSFYSVSNKKSNPVYVALEQEINLYTAYMRKRTAPGYEKPNEEAASRPADTLFELWNSYEPRLPEDDFQKLLLQMADFLVSIKEYKLALRQCYSRYLSLFGDVHEEEITDVETFKNTFFLNGFDGEKARFTFRALMGKCLCAYQLLKQTDFKLQNTYSKENCLALLRFLRLITQAILPKESLCWLVYNGTVHIYNISRHLMPLGYSASVLEFLLWACMCMEASVPLLATHYLKWRATLYTAVCQCYYDCKADQQAEAFARRALIKINELSQLEAKSSSPESTAIETSFRQATIKMAIMVFRRNVFESRKKPKGVLRPKTRPNYKEAINMPWPRTASERLLTEMFEGSSAQFLCILDALNNTNRRTLLVAPPAAENEVDNLDVFTELFMAATEIIAGGGGSHRGTEAKLAGMAGVLPERPLIDLATAVEDGVPLSAVVRFLKLAYNYENWDTFDHLYDNTVAAIKELNDPHHGPLLKDLEVLRAFDRINARPRHRKYTDEDTDVTQEPFALPLPPNQGARGAGGLDDLLNLAVVLLSVIEGPYKKEEIDQDMLVDATLCLWNKCKVVFQKFQSGATDKPQFLYKMDNAGKWVNILDIVHRVTGWTGLHIVDPAMAAEVALRLGLVLDAGGSLDAFPEASKSPKSAIRRQHSSAGTTVTDASMDSAGGSPRYGSRGSALSYMHLEGARPREQLLAARGVLEQGLEQLSAARRTASQEDGRSIADVIWAKELHRALFAPRTETSGLFPNNPQIRNIEVGQGEASNILSTIHDLHLELIILDHRIGLRLAALGPECKRCIKEQAAAKLKTNTVLKDTFVYDPTSKAPKPFKRRTCSHVQKQGNFSATSGKYAYVETAAELRTKCANNHVSAAMFCLQTALTKGAKAEDQRVALEEAKSLLQKAQQDERHLYVDNTLGSSTSPPAPTPVPPAPLLIMRTDNTMLFKPAPFVPPNGDKVAWYRLFGRISSGSNVKVRLNDYYVPGCGDNVPNFRCELRATELVSNETYIFAVAAYTAEGVLIGGQIGNSSRPILASHPLPILLAWAYTAQVGYQVGQTSVATDACSVLWSHFVANPPPPQTVTYVTSAKNDFKLTLHRLNLRLVSLASPILLRMFLVSIFINEDISVKNGSLFCNVVCDKGPLRNGQWARLHQCERLIVALELASWLNEPNMALQAVVQCYGLLAPMIYFKIPSIPVIQVLERCHTILQEIFSSVRQKRPSLTVESLHHMLACLTYHMAKVLRTWGERSSSSSINDSGRKLLVSDWEKEDRRKPDSKDESLMDGNTETGSLTLAALKRKKSKKAVGPGAIGTRDEADHTGNAELKALEAHMLRLTRQSQGEHELSGSEDVSILHAYIAYLPTKVAYAEVVKFRRRQRFLEFFMQIVQKALADGLYSLALAWCKETITWLTKRNEFIIGCKTTVTKQPGAVTVVGDDPKKFAAAMVEYSKDKSRGTAGSKNTSINGSRVSLADANNSNKGHKGKKKSLRNVKYKPLRVDDTMSEAQKAQQEEIELKALDKLSTHLVHLIHISHRRRKLRRTSGDEAPWRSQVNLLQGLSQFGVLVHKIEFREKTLGNASNFAYKTSFLDQEWFTFETVGTLVVGWDGGPSRVPTSQNTRKSCAETEGSRPEIHTTGIEIAAAAATATPVPTAVTHEEDVESPTTHRSDAGKTNNIRRHKRSRSPRFDDVDSETSLVTSMQTIEMLTKTFSYFTQAIVLAHRWHHWTLLQNACRVLWNTTHTSLLRTYAEGDSLISIQSLRSIAWRPFALAADCLLDMLTHLQGPEHTSPKGILSKAVAKPALVPKSWMGSVHTERGGASLHFEEPLDNLSTVDIRSIRRIVLRSLDMLYHEEKWERLVDLAMRFNAVSDNRYVEHVNPLVVQAQRKLMQRLRSYRKLQVPQEHYVAAMKEHGNPLTSKKYVGIQLKMKLNTDSLPQVNPGARLDPTGHSAYSVDDAMRLCSVPLDVKHTLQTFREVVGLSEYTARALKHSRRLLVLYLAGMQNAEGGEGSVNVAHVDFIPVTSELQAPMPPDISKHEFKSADDVQTSPLSRSNISIVITSYKKTIELLLASNHKGLAAEAMHELGNVTYNTGNMKATYKWWSKSLDLLLGKEDSLRKWRSMTSSVGDVSQHLLGACGLWGCVLGGILTSNLAQYMLTADLGLRTECCFLSAHFFKALFRASLPHPVADGDYALYEVGEGCEVTHLVPGVDLLSERFRCDGRTLVAALRFVMDELSRGRHYLFVLPLLTLHQYLTTFVCRDLQRSVDGRILRVSVLTDAGLFSEALITLQRLLEGERLPHPSDSTFRQTESQPSDLLFNTAKPLLDPRNLLALDAVLGKRLSSSLGSLYGPHLTCHLSVVQAHLLVALADTIPVLPQFSDVTGLPGSQAFVTPQTMDTLSRRGTLGLSASMPASQPSPIPSTGYKHARLENAAEEGEVTEKDPVSLTPRDSRLTRVGNVITREEIKGTLLAVGDQILSVMSEIIIENAQHEKGVTALSAAELELVIQARLEQAAIARQRHHAALAARIVVSAMSLLQDAHIFKEQRSTGIRNRISAFKSTEELSINHSSIKLVEPENSQYQYQNFASRSRLDARTWITARLALVHSLLLELRGMGAVKGAERKVKAELADVRLYCSEGVMEAEACGDAEAVAEFLLLSSVLDMQDGIHVDTTKELLAEVLRHLKTVGQLSMHAQLLTVVTMTHMIDLDAAAPDNFKDPSLVTELNMPRYCEAHRLLLDQLQMLGEKVEHHYPESKRLELSTPVAPLHNIYLPHLLPLVQLKLRIGHAMARNATKAMRDERQGIQVSLWMSALGVLMTALELCRVMVTRVAGLEAEILLMMGKVQRQLFTLGAFNMRAVSNTLLSAINTTYFHNHDLGLIHQAYLEIALLYVASKEVSTQKVTTLERARLLSVMDTMADDGSSTASVSAKGKRKRKSRREPRARSHIMTTTPAAETVDLNFELRAAAVAMRCAAEVGASMRARILLTGNTGVTSQTLDESAQAALPEFAVLDLVGSYVLGSKKRIYKDDIEEELAPLVEELEPPPVETYEDQLNKARTAVKGLSWVQVLGYQEILHRLSSTQTLTAPRVASLNPDEAGAGELGPEFDLGFISHAQFDTSLNHDVVRAVLFSPSYDLRLNYLHRFLVTHLPPYARQCRAVYPPAALTMDPPPDSAVIDPALVYTSYAENARHQPATNDTPDVLLTADQRQPPGFTPRSDYPQAATPGDSELCIQWYQPALQEGEASGGSVTGKQDRQILALYSVAKKGIDKPHVSIAWVSLPQLMDLHDRLAVLQQRGEISFIDSKPKKEMSAEGKPAEGKPTKGKKQARIKALSPKLKKDEQLEALLQQCVKDAMSLFGISPEPEPVVAPPTVLPDDAVEKPTPDAKSQAARSDMLTTPVTPAPVPAQPPIPFEVNKLNVQNFEKMFNPSFGGILRENKMFDWFTSLFR